MDQLTENFEFNLTAQAALSLDMKDPLARFKGEFVIDDSELLYLDGNSLGRLPHAGLRLLQSTVSQDWGVRLIRAWGEGWYEAPRRIGDKIGQIVGSAPGQVLVSDSTSVNLFKLVMAALSLKPGRRKIVTDALNFPSDLYILQGCLQLAGAGYYLETVPSHDEVTIDPDDLIAALDRDTAVLVLSHAAFKSGYLYDLASITTTAHSQGALVIWDLSHSVGVVPIALDEAEADFAVGCTYKYLNGGPGAPSFLYINQRWHGQAHSPIWGWFGQHHPFAFDLNYQPANGVQRYLAGTPPILSLLSVEPGVDLTIQAGLPAIRDKSRLLTSYMIYLFDHRLAPLGFRLGTPRQSEQRGSHVSLRHPLGYQINRALIEEMKVIPDFREPDNLRLGLAPLYTSFDDVYQAVYRIERVIAEGRQNAISPDRAPVT